MNKLKQFKRTDSLIASVLYICFDEFIQMKMFYNAIDILTLDFDNTEQNKIKRENVDFKLNKIFNWILFNGIQESLYEINELNDGTFSLYEKLEYLRRFLNLHKIFNVTKS